MKKQANKLLVKNIINKNTPLKKEVDLHTPEKNPQKNDRKRNSIWFREEGSLLKKPPYADKSSNEKQHSPQREDGENIILRSPGLRPNKEQRGIIPKRISNGKKDENEKNLAENNEQEADALRKLIMKPKMFNFLGGIKKIRKFHEKYQNKRMYKQMKKLIDEKINTDEMEEEKAIEKHFSNEYLWKRDILFDDEGDNYNLELIEAFNLRTIRANFIERKEGTMEQFTSLAIYIKK